MLFFILGAADPEMARIESLLKTCHIPYGYAQDDYQHRVHSENAYRACRVSQSKDPAWTSVWVECGPLDKGIPRRMVIDHHFPGDPGYDVAPLYFLGASSLGQSVALLAERKLLPASWLVTLGTKDPSTDIINKGRWFSLRTPLLRSTWVYFRKRWHYCNEDGQLYAIPSDFVLAAAADHCLGHANQHGCLGVKPKELQAWRAESRARKQGIPVSQILLDVRRAIASLQSLPVTEIQGYGFRVAETPIKEIKEASAILGVPVMYSQQDHRSGRLKVAVRNGGKLQIQSWMDWAKDCMKDVYGDPARGFAGAYLN